MLLEGPTFLLPPPLVTLVVCCLEVSVYFVTFIPHSYLCIFSQEEILLLVDGYM